MRAGGAAERTAGEGACGGGSRRRRPVFRPGLVWADTDGRPIQAHGGGGVSDDFPLAAMYAGIRTLRLADGPDEVHKMQVARRELRRYEPTTPIEPDIGRT